MKTFLMGALILVAIALVAIVGWFSLTLRVESPPPPERAAPPEPGVRRNTNDETVVALDEETQQRIGLETQPLVTGESVPERKGFGHVLDPAPLAALVAELAPARVAAGASRQELERLRNLYQETNASLRALQGAQATAERDELLVNALTSRLRLEWGKAIADQTDLPRFVRSLTDLETVLIRLDLPAGDWLDTPPSSARIAIMGKPDVSLDAPFLDGVPSTNPDFQGQGFLFLLRPNAPRLVPGLAVIGFLQLDAPPVRGVVVPRAAMVLHQGRAWVYQQTGAGEFTRRSIALEHPTGQGWLVTQGLTTADRLVTSGAPLLLSEELKRTGLMAGERE